MSSIFVIVIAGLFFSFGIFIYAKYIEKIFEINKDAKTPAVTKYDGVDFVPARNWLILFGHHFSSIAGAAPIVGPVIAVSIWGWGPSIIWIVLGSVFIGGLHDFSSLIISVKSNGSSIADIARNTISYRAKIVFSLFVFLTLILVVAVFTYLCAKTFVADSRVVLPSLGLIPVAMLAGFLLYRLKSNQLTVTILGLILFLGLIISGNFFPIDLGGNLLSKWIIILLIYAFFASITPVNILLQPRDYLSAYLLFFGIGMGYAGLLLSHPDIHTPFFIISSADMPLWPLLFVTVACGAVSGFHSLIASGTTSKQLPNQVYAKRIGYGAMIFEGILAMLALLCVSAGLSNYDSFKAILEKGGPIVAFSKGFGNITRPILGKFGAVTAIVILNAFILTTLDTATRISRYVFEELTGIRNRWFSTSIVVILAGSLAWGGRWRLIWPTFGASNQLVAALTLLVITTWLLSRNKPIKLVLPAAIFMLITTIAALCVQISNYFRQHQTLLLIISSVLIILAIFIMCETIRTFLNKYKQKRR